MTQPFYIQTVLLTNHKPFSILCNHFERLLLINTYQFGTHMETTEIC